MSMTATEAATRAAPQASVTRLVRPRERQTPLVVLGVLLVAGCALAAVLFARSGQRSVEVVVAARDLRPGQPIEAADLRVTQVSTDTDASFVSAAHLAELVGQFVRGYEPAGTPLNLQMIEAGAALGPGEDVVGAVLAAGAIPVGGLRPGDTVEVLVVAKAADSDGPEAPPADLGAAVVYEVAPASSDPTDGTWVSLRQPGPLGLKIAQAAADGTLRLALVAGRG
jgi:Flp pilus assembly protein CpaB